MVQQQIFKEEIEMKKKILALLLSAVMLLALAACGGQPTPTATPAPATPTPAPSEPAAESTVYTTVINDADVTFTLAADQKSIVVDAMGMTVEGTCEVADNVLTFGEQTSGNAQIWASLGKNQYTLNADGTAAIGSAEGQESGGEELFAWEGFAALVFNKDGTYNFNYNDMVKESGTWKWENWTLTVTDANGTEMTGSVDSEDNNTLKLTFTAIANSELVVDFTAASSVWGPALGASGTYAPAD